MLINQGKPDQFNLVVSFTSNVDVKQTLGRFLVSTNSVIKIKLAYN